MLQRLKLEGHSADHFSLLRDSTRQLSILCTPSGLVYYSARTWTMCCSCKLGSYWRELCLQLWLIDAVVKSARIMIRRLLPIRFSSLSVQLPCLSFFSGFKRAFSNNTLNTSFPYCSVCCRIPLPCLSASAFLRNERQTATCRARRRREIAFLRQLLFNG